MSGRICNRNGCLYVSGVEGTTRPLKFPSAMYPLPGNSFSFFTSENTKQCENETVRAIYDSLPFKIGQCFQNAAMLKESLLAEGIQDVRTYAGWTFVSIDMQPTPHCFVSVGDDEVLDPSVFDLKRVPHIPEDMPIEQARELFVEMKKKDASVPASERTCFGKVLQGHCYIAGVCDPEAGAAMFRKMSRAYPKHPAILKTNSSGQTKLQELMAQKGVL